MKKQGLIVTINQLRKLANDLEHQAKQLNLELNTLKYNYDYEFQINIINKEGLSDTWGIEG